ncbi:MAG: glycosyltransferase family 2 protein, partial [Ignavibacteriaceae bacterium]|nr:glycosyltransferase family 2 protein [Ignavibacteriaceae bacterium]
MPSNPVLSLIVPFYNEEESLPMLLDQICQAMEEKELHALFELPFTFELLMIDDGSTDGSSGFIRKQIDRRPEVKLVSLQKNFGKTAALAAGFRYASGEIVVTLDADLQDDPFTVKELVAKLQEGYDLVSGWKRQRNDPLSKTIPSRIFNTTTRLLTGI